MAGVDDDSREGGGGDFQLGGRQESRLFRLQVMRIRSEGWLGPLSISQPTRLRTLIFVAIASTLALVLLLVFGSFTRRERVKGHLVPTQGLATVVTPEGGAVVSLPVQEGQMVRAGQTIALIAMPRTTAGGSTIAALKLGIDRRQASLRNGLQADEERLNVQQASLEMQVASAQTELRQIDSEIALRQGKIVIAQDTLERMKKLLADRYVSDLQAQQQEALVIDGEAEVQALQRQATSLRRQLEQWRLQTLEMEPERIARKADAEVRIQSLDAERIETIARGEVQVQASVDGMVASLSVKVGQSVQAGQALSSIIPGEGLLEAELLVPSRAIGFISPGDRVLLRYDAYPYQKFGHQRGRIERITRSALDVSELGRYQGTLGQDEALYRVVVRLDQQSVLAYGRQESLRPGMLLEADILGERRRLIEWVLDPLYSVRGQVGE